MAGKSTFNRLELHPRAGSSVYHQIMLDEETMSRLFVELFLESHLHSSYGNCVGSVRHGCQLRGEQERFFHG